VLDPVLASSESVSVPPVAVWHHHLRDLVTAAPPALRADLLVLSAFILLISFLVCSDVSRFRFKTFPTLRSSRIFLPFFATPFAIFRPWKRFPLIRL
jgi:hypothetical protein